jgi:DNA repair protein RecO (recombination protein O)
MNSITACISPAIIMRIRAFGESDLLVGFFTSERGRLKGVAKGAQRSQKRFANCLDLFCLTNLEYEPSRRGDLCFLHSCKLIRAFPGIRADFFALSLASYMVELTEILFPLGVVDGEMFELLKNSLHLLGENHDHEKVRILFEARAMALGGYGINFRSCNLCGRPYTGQGRAVFLSAKGGIACLKCQKETAQAPGLGPDTAEAFNIIQSAPWSRVEKLHLTGGILDEMKAVLEVHIGYRIGQRLKAKYFLEGAFSSGRP